MEPQHLYLIFAALFGAIVGSFLNVVIFRLPEENGSVVFPASHCPKCKTKLSWYENIPVISYLVQRGKCRHCETSISLQYPVVEIITSVLTLAIVNKFGISVETFGYFLFIAALVVIIFIDIHHQIIPDVISLPGTVIGFLFSFVNPYVSWLDSLIGLFVGGGVLYLVAFLYFTIRKVDGMGGGDIKLLAMIGAFLGWQSLPFVIFASSFTGAVIGMIFLAVQKKDSQTRIPFGPFLSLGALGYLFFGELINSYFTLYITGQWP